MGFWFLLQIICTYIKTRQMRPGILPCGLVVVASLTTTWNCSRHFQYGPRFHSPSALCQVQSLFPSIPPLSLKVRGQHSGEIIWLYYHCRANLTASLLVLEALFWAGGLVGCPDPAHARTSTAPTNGAAYSSNLPCLSRGLPQTSVPPSCSFSLLNTGLTLEA